MKRKEYQKPMMQVVKLQQQTHLMAGSQGQADVQDYNWNEEVTE